MSDSANVLLTVQPAPGFVLSTNGQGWVKLAPDSLPADSDLNLRASGMGATLVCPAAASTVRTLSVRQSGTAPVTVDAAVSGHTYVELSGSAQVRRQARPRDPRRAALPPPRPP